MQKCSLKLNPKSIITVIIIAIIISLLVGCYFYNNHQSLQTPKTPSPMKQEMGNLIKKEKKEGDKERKEAKQRLSHKYPPKVEYYKDINTILSITYYNQKTGNQTKQISYCIDGTIWYTEECNQNGKKIKTTYYNKDSNINRIYKFDENTRKITKSFYYNKDGSIWIIFEYNSITGEQIKTTYYNENGNIKSITEHKPFKSIASNFIPQQIIEAESLCQQGEELYNQSQQLKQQAIKLYNQHKK
ncbi:DUF2963 domain-containing protein [Candidatus Phytoplasma meliae]|uniref:DUF2963 domain-containing protein n=1 Tax=Candidatus Phytoplasma meliae TaxID=1848402 RepID=A0ABS5CYS3_9MOLU|nr:DUF2963 domain-containing protein [Candidatus Phytoplasma meliae]MBP5836121.1 DUF2963 domain-containing protein [Candidatus Phytoplasma meliae]